MAGSIEVTTREIIHNIVRYRVAWTSDASGDVNANLFDMMVGTITAVEFHPGTGGVAPDALYDVDLLDENSISLFDDGAGTTIGVNLPATGSVQRIPLIGQAGITVYRRWHHGGSVQLTVSAAGAANQGTVDIYLLQGVL